MSRPRVALPFVLLSVLAVAGCGSSGARTAAAPARPSSALPTGATPTGTTPTGTAPTSATPNGQGAASPTARLSVGPSNTAQKPSPRPTRVRLRVVKQNGAALVLADLVIHGRPEVFLVDTGASVTLISQRLATQLRLPTSRAAFPVSGVGGGTTVHAVSISDWKLGGSNLPTSTITTGTQFDNSVISGLLGSDVLSTFGTVTIDYAHEVGTLG